MKKQINQAAKVRDYEIGEDRISRLPDPVLHHILAFLSTKDVIRTSALSKFWNLIWKSFPVLQFDQYAYETSKRASDEKRDHEKVEQEFCDYINGSINSRTGLTSIQKFSLVVHFKRCANTRNGDINRWLHFAIYKAVKKVTITYHNIANASNGWQYVVPQCLFNTLSLENLKLFGCRFIHCQSIGVVAFSLRTLILTHVQTNEDTLQRVICSCTLLQKLSMEYCKGFSSIMVVAKSLKFLNLYLDRQDVQIVAVEAPLLQSLSYAGGYSNVKKSLVASKFYDSLTTLTLHDVDVTDGFFRIMPKFTKLRKLELIRCCFIYNLKIANDNLVAIRVCQCVRLKNIELCTCRLRTCQFE